MQPEGNLGDPAEVVVKNENHHDGETGKLVHQKRLAPILAHRHGASPGIIWAISFTIGLQVLTSSGSLTQ